MTPVGQMPGRPMTPLVRMVHAIASALLHPGELDTVEEVGPNVGWREVTIKVHGRGALGTIIGQAGETITAIRHLARRVGKRHTPPLQVHVEAVDVVAATRREAEQRRRDDEQAPTIMDTPAKKFGITVEVRNRKESDGHER